MELENKVDYTVYREDIEKAFGKLTDKEWEVFSSEIEDAIDKRLEQMSADIIDNLEHLVEQDRKYD
jgi:hypothetical protein